MFCDGKYLRTCIVLFHTNFTIVGIWKQKGKDYYMTINRIQMIMNDYIFVYILFNEIADVMKN